jgi:hypothetical protein
MINGNLCHEGAVVKKKSANAGEASPNKKPKAKRPKIISPSR